MWIDAWHVAVPENHVQSDFVVSDGRTPLLCVTYTYDTASHVGDRKRSHLQSFEWLTTASYITLSGLLSAVIVNIAASQFWLRESY